MADWKPEIRRQLVGLQLTPMREAAIIEEFVQARPRRLLRRLEGLVPPSSEGRAFTTVDRDGAEPVAIISETLRRRAA